MTDPSGSLEIDAALNAGCGEGGVTAAHDADVDITSHRNDRATAAESDSREGDVGESEHATDAMSPITQSRMRTITSVYTGERVFLIAIQMSCQR